MPTFNPYMDTHAINKYQFLHHFLPHPETKRRARLLSHTALLTYSIVMVAVIGIFQFLPQVAPGVLGYASNINAADLLIETNEARADEGLSPLTVNHDLEAAARKKAAHMFQQDYWAHVSPDGVAPWDFILNEGYDYTYAGENLAKNFRNSDHVVKGWIQSPSHRDNLLNTQYQEIGFAVMDGVLQGYETTLVVQMFGKPRGGVAAIVDAPAIPADERAAETPKVAVVPSADLAPSMEQETQVLPAIDVTLASKTITLLIGGFLVFLLLLDIWYSKKKAIPKITGNAFAHVLMFVFTLVGVWFALSPGKIL
ncbi:CAP domain-containing protein [candidate division WWE3 bacterium]|jgi:uncharacterized protein YkwD|nr:CAP domain-containing protein [candidate division WWE3 bacterium]MBT7349488.1 CAP domain-containing protein [candidate division WWE3 bacterium]